MTTFKPMLAHTITDTSTIQYPVMISPKLDGIRCLILDSKPVSRKLLDIPNRHVQKLLSNNPWVVGLDGELIVGKPTDHDVYRKTMSAVMSQDGDPDFTFYVFDIFMLGTHPYSFRYEELGRLTRPDHVRVLPHVVVHDEAGLVAVEEQWLAEGYEGVMVRSLDGPYKWGRSTEKQGYLGKLKRFAQEEFEIVGFQERMHNANEAQVDELGHTKRSSHKENLVGRGDLGAVELAMHDGRRFFCGTGFDDAQRLAIWRDQGAYLGKQATIKFFPSGGKDLPRFPVWGGLRDPIDMGEPA